MTVPEYNKWAKYYDFAHHDRSVMVEFYTGLVTKQTRSLLELGCGTGVITTALADAMEWSPDTDSHFRVTGVDHSIEMLRIGRERNPEIGWIVADFCDPPISWKYDLVICCFNTLQMLLDDADITKTFGAVRELLATDGRFVFDIYQPNEPYLHIPQRNRLVRTVVDENGRTIELREDATYDSATRILDLHWRLVEQDRPETILTTLHDRLRQYFPDDIARFLADAGLVMQQRYGDFDRSPFSGTSRKQIVFCRRAA